MKEYIVKFINSNKKSETAIVEAPNISEAFLQFERTVSYIHILDCIENKD